MAFKLHNSPFKCWQGYERVPGTRPGAKGSCRKSSPAKRRKSFCARSKGWTGERGKAARRRWKC